MRMNMSTVILALSLLIGAVQPAFAGSGCPDGHDCCPPDQQLPCDHGRGGARTP